PRPEPAQSSHYIAQGSGGRAGDLSSTASAATRSGAAQQYKAIRAFYAQTDQAADHFRALLAQYEGAYSGVAQQEVSAAVDGLDTLHYLRRGSTRTLLSPLVVVQKYADLIDNLLVIDDQAAQGTG